MNAVTRLAALILAAAPACAQQAPRGDAEIVHWDREVEYAAPAKGPSPCGDAEFLRDMQEFRDSLSANPVKLQGGAAPLAAPKKALEDGLRSTLTAMGDGIEVGGILTGRLDAAGIKVAFAKQDAASALSTDGKTITLSDALPPAPRVLAPWIGREAAEGLLAAMPASAERAYMRLSYMTRVWLELGGSPSSLPAIETIKEIRHEDPKLAADFSLWIKSFMIHVSRDQNPETIAEATGKAHKLPTLAELRKKAQKADDKAKLDEAARSFKAFIDAERMWFRVHRGTVDL